MAEGELIALEAQFILVTIGTQGGIGGAAVGRAAAVLAIEIAQLAVVIVVDLTAALELQREVVAFVRGQRQAACLLYTSRCV